ncbi:DUF817 domain-containing protein [Dyella flava]|uniref:DUF817 domain-containing protein n=1 Tax=Dyella flava TaxID=1920170 RepID=A0ABS2K763_9GAMM|nr:DUF817 domain-containing protein [Dyella flava]MBM7127006.1 DUF817 domain-containing protein [Dyella flava]GLQ50233.1 hypothetical protein GCM10010872_16820 [Dyella flava]
MERSHPFTLLSAIRRMDDRVGAWAWSRGRCAIALHEFVCFGAKQASACLFGGCMVLLLGLTWACYPHQAVLTRYDFLTLAAVLIQCLLLAARLETWEETRVIMLFHVVGTVMEVFKTAMGSWIYPEACLLHIGGVPLFTGFMYGSIGSYIARAWRLFEFRFTHHPPLFATVSLAIAIYVNFFTHHFFADIRLLLFAAAALLFGRTWVHFRIRRVHRRMPLLLGFVLVATFIWIAENVGTFTAVWRYPAQHHGWRMVPLSKLGAWFLLMIISYVMVSAVARRRSARASRQGRH